MQLDSCSAAQLEAQHVHSVYDAIAPHFSSTRHSKWPQVSEFLESFSEDAVVCDVGCGNGKYLDAVRVIGCDYSLPLCKICMRKGFQVLQADGLNLPFQSDRFDGLISIAVIHHFANAERRKNAIEEMKRVLRRGTGRGLIYVWAFEQDGRFQGKFENQDAFVPWNLASRFNSSEEKKEVQDFKRYYHLFKKGELEELIESIDGLEILKSGYDHQNWWVEFLKFDTNESEKNLVDRLDEFVDDFLNQVDDESDYQLEEEHGVLNDLDFELFEDDEKSDADSPINSLESLQESAMHLLKQLKAKENIPGIEKLSRRVSSECKYIESLKSDDSISLISSNVSYYKGVVEALDSYSGITSVFSRFYYTKGYLRKESDDLPTVPKGKMSSCTMLDIVCDSGHTWVKVRSSSIKNAHRIGKEGERNILELAKHLTFCASQNLVDFVSPQIVFHFSNRVSEELARRLSNMGIRIRIQGDKYINFSGVLFYTPVTPTKYECINFDVSTMLALCSELANNATSTSFEYEVPSLDSQAKNEAKNPVIPDIMNHIEGKIWIVTSSALKRFKDIVNIVGGKNEKERADLLISRFRIVKDIPSKRAALLGLNCKENESIRLLKVQITKSMDNSEPFSFTKEDLSHLDPNFIVFGTADQLRIPTISSNVSFIRSCEDRGVKFTVVLHSARALTEKKVQKYLSSTSIK